MTDRTKITLEEVLARAERDGANTRAVADAELIESVRHGGAAEQDPASDRAARLAELEPVIRMLDEADAAGSRGDPDAADDDAAGPIAKIAGGRVQGWFGNRGRLLSAAAALVAVVGGIAIWGGGGAGGPQGGGLPGGGAIAGLDPDLDPDDGLFEAPVNPEGILGLRTEPIDWGAFAAAEAEPGFGTTLGNGRPVHEWRSTAVIIRTEHGMGSGVVISEDGWALTNFHVVESAWLASSISGEPARVQVIRGAVEGGVLVRVPGESDAVVYRADPVNDLALIKIERREEDPAFTVVGFGEPPELGAECFKIGSPAGDAPWNFQPGRVTNRYAYPEGLTNYQVSAASPDARRPEGRLDSLVVRTDIPTSGGDSGGPLLDGQGRLIGLTFATTVAGNSGSVGLHIDISRIRAFTASMPEEPEVIPFDFWTTGFWHPQRGQQFRLEPSRSASDSDTVAVMVGVPAAGGGGRHQLVGRARIALAEGLGAGSPAVPAGLWGAPVHDGAAGYSFALAQNTRMGVTAAEYRRGDGSAEQRIDRDGDGAADRVLRRSAAGVWTEHEPGGVRVYDPELAPESSRAWAAEMLGERSGGTGGRATPPSGKGPRPGPGSEGANRSRGG